MPRRTLRSRSATRYCARPSWPVAQAKTGMGSSSCFARGWRRGWPHGRRVQRGRRRAQPASRRPMTLRSPSRAQWSHCSPRWPSLPCRKTRHDDRSTREDHADPPQARRVPLRPTVDGTPGLRESREHQASVRSAPARGGEADTERHERASAATQTRNHRHTRAYRGARVRTGCGPGAGSSATNHAKFCSPPTFGPWPNSIV